MTLLVAPDKFKGTFSAHAVADALATGIEAAGTSADRCPVADGGDGTMAVLIEPLGGRAVEVEVRDPLGRPARATLGLLDDGDTAIVEVAQASGLGMVAESDRDAEAASTAGTGELIAAAVAQGARTILVAAGGSATTDGGAGAIAAIEDAGGLGKARLVVLSDTTVPFEAAAAVFGAQKGADPQAVERLTARLHARAAALPRDPRGRPMSGAAGGLSGGLWAVYGAQLSAGASFVLDALGFDARLRGATAVVTGEGRVDEQTLRGKAVGEIAARARAAGVPLVLAAGSSTLGDPQLRELGARALYIATDVAALRRVGEAIAVAETNL